MRVRWPLLFGLLMVTVLPALGQTTGGYDLKITDKKVWTEDEGNRTVTKGVVDFIILDQKTGQEVKSFEADARVVLYEDGKKVGEVRISRASAKQQELSVVLTVDISGSMKEGQGEENRMHQAKQAANVFFEKLPPPAEAGLILFDHEIRLAEPLSKNRQHLKDLVNQAQPMGGTAYLDACLKGLQMVKNVPSDRQKAIVLVTDGMDLNSKATLSQVIAAANQAKVKVFTVGIGQPGKQQDVTSVLVLDRSGSMLLPSDDNVKISKLEALKAAAKLFVQILPEANKTSKHRALTTIFQFSDDTVIGIPFVGANGQETLLPYFTNKKAVLNKTIDKLVARGETTVYDATYDAIATLEAENAPGKNVVVTLTDGIDNVSRRRPEEVIKRAQDAKIALYMLGFGRKGEVDEAVMRNMAKATGGEYYLASRPEDLMQIFESLSVKIHDEGIDEEALTRLASGTGGKYYPAKNVSELKFILQEVTQRIQAPARSIPFVSNFQRRDSLTRSLTLSLFSYTYSSSGQIQEKKEANAEDQYHRTGLVLAQMSPMVYLGFLILFGLLIALPAGLGRLTKSSAAR